MFNIIPCGEDKIPLIHSWGSSHTTDQNKIKHWQDTFKDRLVYWGITTGAINGLYVLDIDTKNGVNGFETLNNYMLANNYTLPKTMTQTTRSGGKHHVFKYPKDGRHYPNKNGFLPGLDIRGEGGQIIHYGFDDTPIADAPQWLLDLTGEKLFEPPKGDPIKVAPSISAEVLHSSLDKIRNAAEGERNHTLNTESFRVGQLVKAGAISKEYADQALMLAAKEIGMPEREARSTINSGLKGGDNKPLVSPFSNEPPAPQFIIPPVPVPTRWTPPPMEMADLFNVQHLKRPQLFQDWSTQDIHITVADGGTGKSTLKLYEAVCLALGERFLGFNCVQPGKTLYLTGEDSEKKLTAMIGMIITQMGFKNDYEKVKIILDSISIKKDDNLCLISKDREHFLSYNQAALNSMLEAVHDLKPKMIVIDPIASFWGSEAAVNDMGKAVSKFVSKLAYESNACVEMINHAGKVSSSTKDMTQFAGRGGTGLVSHSRVARVLMSIDNKKYTELTNKSLDDNQSAMVCNVNKFTDGSPLLNKPFIIVRDGYLFSRQQYEVNKAEEERQESDIERVFSFIQESRRANKYPTRPVIVGHFMIQADKISEARTKRAIDLLVYAPRIKPIENPDVTSREQVYITLDNDGKEI